MGGVITAPIYKISPKFPSKVVRMKTQHVRKKIQSGCNIRANAKTAHVVILNLNKARSSPESRSYGAKIPKRNDSGTDPSKGGATNIPRKISPCRGKGVYGRAIGTVRSEAEPWNERRVKNVSFGAKATIGPTLILVSWRHCRSGRGWRRRSSRFVWPVRLAVDRIIVVVGQFGSRARRH